MACAIGGEEGSSSPSRMVPPMELSREPPCAPQMPSPRMLWFCGPGCGTHAVPLNMVSSRHEGRENKGHWWRKRERSFGHGRRVLCGQGKWSWQGTPMRQQHALSIDENAVRFNLFQFFQKRHYGFYGDIWACINNFNQSVDGP